MTFRFHSAHIASVGASIPLFRGIEESPAYTAEPPCMKHDLQRQILVVYGATCEEFRCVSFGGSVG